VIGFLQPLLGLAALAAAVPIILHLIRRRERRRLSFPAVRYLHRAEERYAQRLRLRHLLLLAARVLIVLLLAAAAAGPLIGRGGAADHEPTAVAVVIDESLSGGRLLGDERLVDAYRHRLQATLDLMGQDDRIALFSAVRPAEGAVAAGPDGVGRVIGSLRPTAGLARPGAALQEAVTWLRASTAAALEIHLFTDLQEISLPDAVAPADVDSGTGVTVVAYAPAFESQVNAAPGYPQPERLPLDAGQGTRVSIPVGWWGAAPPDSSTVVRLLVDGAVVAVGEAQFGGAAVLSLPPRESGWVSGQVEIDGHGLALDDRRYFAWFVRPLPSVAITGSVGDFLLRALTTLEGGGRLRLVSPTSADVWVAGSGERLEEALGTGRAAIVLPPSEPLDLPRLNFRLERAGVPWRYERVNSAGVSRIAETASVTGLAGLTVARTYSLQPRVPGVRDTTLLGLQSGEPWLVRGTTAQGAAYLLLGSPLVPDASEVPVSAAMVPFIDVLVGDWTRREVVEPSAYEGVARLRLPARAREVSLPDGTSRGVEGGAWFLADMPGTYTVSDGASVLHAFSINAPLAESDLTAGERDAMEPALPAAEWIWRSGEGLAGWREAVFRSRRGHPAWRPLVVLLLVLSIVEATLAAAGRRRERRTARGVSLEPDSEASGSAVH